MNIRDSIYRSDLTEADESAYGRAYRKAYRVGDAEGFRRATRTYLRNLRSWPQAVHQLNILMGAHASS
jgi:hypothetical protein